jgi:hypothetical protein
LTILLGVSDLPFSEHGQGRRVISRSESGSVCNYVTAKKYESIRRMAEGKVEAYHSPCAYEW